MTLNKITNDKGVSYCVSMYDKVKKEYCNQYITFAEFYILKECFEKLGYKYVEKDFRK